MSACFTPRLLAATLASLALGSTLAAQTTSTPSFTVKSALSQTAPHPNASVLPDQGQRIVGGGGVAAWSGSGSLLHRLRPWAGSWEAGSKDHMFPDPAQVTAYLVQFNDPAGLYDVLVVEAVSPVTNRPTVRATLPAGFTLTGGGCWSDWQSTNGPGQLLTGSYPDEVDRRSWICEAKDHLSPNPAALHAYAFGIRAKTGSQPTMTISRATSTVEAAPTARVTVAPGYEVTGGGARAEAWRTATLAGTQNQTAPSFAQPSRFATLRAQVPDSGELLTASFPVMAQGTARVATGWEARAKDHGVSSPGTVTAYVIGVRLPPPPPPPPPPPASPTCFCTAVGPFAAPVLGQMTGGPQGTFMHPTDGAFTVTAHLVSGQPNLSITDAQGRSVLSVSGSAAWGPSPGGRFFAVVGSPIGTNAGSPLTIYRVAKSPTGFKTVVSSSVWPDGRWGFSADGSIALIERLENAPTRYSLDAHNLLAGNPTLAVVRKQELSVFQPGVTMSPCGDRLMYSRWVQLNPQQGQADFYARKDLPSLQQTLFADWDGTAPTMSAKVEAGATMNSFLVKLTGARLRSGQTSFASRQCEAP